MKTLTVNPSAIIQGSQGAQVRHTEPSPVTVKATNQDGASVTFVVPVGQSYTWEPPDEGWTAVTFTASGFNEESRVIEWTARAGGA